MRSDGKLRSIILVEGVSDRSAIETLAERRGLNLSAEGISVIEMGGATQIGTYLDHYGPHGLGLRLAGLYDAGEAEVISRSLGRAGLGSNLTPGDMESLGFYMCVDDLEDELIRSVGMESIEQVAEAAGDLRSFRTFQNQPAWRGRPFDQQFRRFLGAGARRKIRYAGLLVQAMDLTHIPRPLEAVLEHVRLRE
jgi:Overcoming lysogenization defect protein-like, TOPRIM domain